MALTSQVREAPWLTPLKTSSAVLTSGGCPGREGSQPGWRRVGDGRARGLGPGRPAARLGSGRWKARLRRLATRRCAGFRQQGAGRADLHGPLRLLTERTGRPARLPPQTQLSCAPILAEPVFPWRSSACGYAFDESKPLRGGTSRGKTRSDGAVGRGDVLRKMAAGARAR